MRIRALIAKDGIRLREFFIDFDKLRKGVVGEAAVSRSRFNLTFVGAISSGLASGR